MEPNKKTAMSTISKTIAEDSTTKKKNLLKHGLETMKRGLNFVWKDLRKTHLIWVKVVFFLQSASLVTLYPYLTIHLKALGFTIEDASIVNSVIPGADIFGPPLAGFLADKLGNFRIFMALLTFFNGASSLLLLAIPSMMTSTSSSESTESIFQQHQESFTNLTTTSTNLTSFNNATIVQNNNHWYDQYFWTYLLVRVLLDILRASSLMLFEGAVVSIIKQHGGDYGLQKLFGTFGAIIFGPLSGILIDFGHGATAYNGVIIMYFVLRTLTAICVLKLNLGFKPRGAKVLANLSHAMCKIEILAFLAAFLVAGILWGYLENFLFWHLEDLGATKFLMGMSLAVGTLAGLPMTMFSKLLIQTLGHRKIVTIALLLYAMRMFGFAELTRAEPFLILEVAKPFCTTLLLISVMTFVKDNAPLTTMATMEAIFGSSYFGVGRGLGGLFGGLSIEAFGDVTSFRIFGGLAVLIAVMYSVTMTLERCRKSRKYHVNKKLAPV